jgi:hypothetical protein
MRLNGITGPWTAEWNARLRSLWNKDYTSADIRKIMGLTRGQLSGRARRLRLNFAELKRMSNNFANPAKNPAIKEKSRKAEGDLVFPSGTFPPDGRDVRGCQFIFGHPREGDWRFCQKPRLGETSWCHEHFDLVYRSPDARPIGERLAEFWSNSKKPGGLTKKWGDS